MKNTLILSILFLLLLGLGCANDDSQDPDIPLVADFVSDKTTFGTDEQVTFQETSTGNPTAWSWTFEGGTPATSTVPNPVVKYEEEGDFSVTLTIFKNEEEDAIVKENFIKVVTLFDGNELPDTGPCQLEKIFTNDYVDLGFPNNGPSPSLGQVNVQVLFADFSDAPSSGTTTTVFDLLDPINQQFYEEMSYGRMDVNLLPHHEWLRLSMPSSHYAEGLNSGSGHLAFIQEAVDLADSQVDFSEADIVVVMSNPDATAIGFGPAFGSLSDGFAIQADGNSIRTGITSGYDLNNWGGIWLAHEMGHSLGLLDLYSFSGADIHRHVGGFSIMGLISGDAPGFFAYERWLLGWLDDDQIYCHSEGSIVIELTELATAGGLKALSVPLSNTSSLVIESRKKRGFDSSISKEGVLVYIVDTAVERGGGPIEVKRISGGLKENAPMAVGDVYTFQDVRIEVLDSRSSSDIVSVSIQ